MDLLNRRGTARGFELGITIIGMFPSGQGHPKVKKPAFPGKAGFDLEIWESKKFPSKSCSGVSDDDGVRSRDGRDHHNRYRNRRRSYWPLRSNRNRR